MAKEKSPKEKMGMKHKGKTKDMSVGASTAKAKNSANVQKTFPGRTGTKAK